MTDRSAPPSPEKPRPQSERFIETARKLDADESGEAFERAFKKIVPPKKPVSRDTEPLDNGESKP